MNRPETAALRMAEPADLAGDWEVILSDRRCTLGLTADRVEAVNAYALTGAECLTDLLPAAAAGWRPAPDGIELAGADRRTLALFADQGDGTARATLGAGTATLRRAR